jgi:hypothetical protein
MAFAATLLTGVLAANAAGVALAVTFVAFALLALVAPAAIVTVVLVGQGAVVWSLLDEERGDPVAAALIVAGVVATAELLAIVARLDMPMPRDPRADVSRAGLATAIGLAAFAAVGAATLLPGPGGLPAVVIASAACGLLAVVVGRRAASGTLPSSRAKEPPSLEGG